MFVNQAIPIPNRFKDADLCVNLLINHELIIIDYCIIFH